MRLTAFLRLTFQIKDPSDFPRVRALSAKSIPAIRDFTAPAKDFTMKSGLSRFGLWKILPVVCILALFYLILSGCLAQPDPKQVKRDGMIRHVLIGLEFYEQLHKEWPPRSTQGPDGTPHTSWRALLIPQIDFQVDKDFVYDLDQPWDNPHNAAWKSRPPIYYSLNEDQRCHLIMVYPGNPQFADLDLSKNLGDVAVLAEIGSSDLFWSEPQDSCAAEDEARIRRALSNLRRQDLNGHPVIAINRQGVPVVLQHPYRALNP